MKTMIAGVSALLLSGSAAAASLDAQDAAAPLGPARYSYTSIPPMGSSSFEQALVEAGIRHALMQQADSMNPDQWTGVGGPEEPITTVWPACRPGPGDDRCIQLYERGVRSSYAAWTNDRSDVGMGGPEEHMADAGVAANAHEMLTPKDPSLAPMSVSTADGSSGQKEHAMMQHPVMASDPLTAEEMRTGSAMGAYQGVGGPDEEPRVYPRCRSRIDDRCQQGR